MELQATLPANFMRIEWLRFLEQIEKKGIESKFELGISVKWKNIKTEHEIKIF